MTSSAIPPTLADYAELLQPPHDSDVTAVVLITPHDDTVDLSFWDVPPIVGHPSKPSWVPGRTSRRGDRPAHHPPCHPPRGRRPGGPTWPLPRITGVGDRPGGS